MPTVDKALFFKVQDIMKEDNEHNNHLSSGFPLSLLPKRWTKQIRKHYHYYALRMQRNCSTHKVHAAFEDSLTPIVAKKKVMTLYQQISRAFFGQNNDESLGKIKKI